jgi:hypothetical protein
MKDETVDGPMKSPAGDNRPDLAELRAKASDQRFDALLARLPFGSASSAADDRKVAWWDDEPEDEPPFAEPQAVVLISLKRVDGTRAEVDRFKKGYRIRSWAEADETLRQWAQTVPEGSTHRVAYMVEVADGARFYGTLPLAGHNDPLRSWVIKDNGLDPVYLKAT